MFGIQKRICVLVILALYQVQGEVTINFVVPNPDSIQTCENMNIKAVENLQETVKNLTEKVSRLNTTTAPVYVGGLPTSSSPALNAKTKCGCSCNSKVDFHFEYRDCQDVRTLSPLTLSGVYNVFPIIGAEHLLITKSPKVSGKFLSIKTADPFPVYCELSSSHQFGWTVLQRRVNFDVNFNRSWSEYKHGFGDKTGDFWLGLEQMHILTNQKFLRYLLRITFWYANENPSSFDFADFKVDSKAMDYTVNFGNRIGSYMPYLEDFSGAKFSTFDHDKDQTYAQNCGHKGGWWYQPKSGYPCGYTHLNAAKPYLRSQEGVRKVELKIRPMNA